MSEITRTCTFEADGAQCEKPRYSRDYCTAHYRQLLNGKPLRPLRAYVRRGPECLAGNGCTGKPHSHGYCKVHWQRLSRYGRLERVRIQNTPDATCSVEIDGIQCEEPVKANGYCEVHYMRVRRHGEPGPVGSQVSARRGPSRYAGLQCAVEVDGVRCDRPVKCLTWCNMHYQRWKRTGDPAGKWGVSTRQSQGYTTSDGYRMAPSRRNGRPVLEHRLVMEQIIGRPLHRFEEPHHKNGMRDDNRPEDLELWVKWRQPAGQRLTDLIDFILTNYPDEVRTAQAARMAEGERPDEQ